MFDAAMVEQLQKASVVDTRPAPARLTTTPDWYRPITAECFLQEARRQSLEPWRLLAVMKVEDGRVGTFRSNTNGSYDIGPMQVNSVHLEDMAKVFGVERSQLAQLLAYDGCFNVSVGAWLLRTKTNEVGGDFWYGIGRYHSKTNEKSTRYILRVHTIMQDIVKPTSLRSDSK
jgi:hypothetical protein